MRVYMNELDNLEGHILQHIHTHVFSNTNTHIHTQTLTHLPCRDGARGLLKGDLLIVPIDRRSLVDAKSAITITACAHVRANLRAFHLLERPHGGLTMCTVKGHRLNLREHLRAPRHHPDDTHKLVQVDLTEGPKGKDNLMAHDADMHFIFKHGFVMPILLKDNLIGHLVEDLQDILRGIHQPQRQRRLLHL